LQGLECSGGKVGWDFSLLAMIGKQQAESLTRIPDPASLAGQLPSSMTPAMLEMNLGLQRGMGEFRYGARKAALARRLSDLKEVDVRQAAKKYLSATTCSAVSLQPGSR
jgi:hypothetical protein